MWGRGRKWMGGEGRHGIEMERGESVFDCEWILRGGGMPHLPSRIFCRNVLSTHAVPARHSLGQRKTEVCYGLRGGGGC